MMLYWKRPSPKPNRQRCLRHSRCTLSPVMLYFIDSCCVQEKHVHQAALSSIQGTFPSNLPPRCQNYLGSSIDAGSDELLSNTKTRGLHCDHVDSSRPIYRVCHLWTHCGGELAFGSVGLSRRRRNGGRVERGEDAWA